MKKGTKIAVIVALAVVAAGIMISVAAMALLNFNFGRMNTVMYDTKTHYIEDDFSNISVIGAECDVRLIPTDDNKCKVICTDGEDDKIFHSVSVSQNTLKIERHDNRKWFEHFGIYFGSMNVEIYLPKSEYENLEIKTASGRIDVSDTFTFDKATADSASGDINVCSQVKSEIFAKSVSGKVNVENACPNNLSAGTTSGSVEVKNVTANGDFKANTVSGRVTLDNIKCKNLRANTTSGRIELISAIADGRMSLGSTSGRVSFDGCDADSIDVKTVSGRVEGSLLSDKIFNTETTSGSVNVPRSAAGGDCYVKTVSGSIDLRVE